MTDSPRVTPDVPELHRSGNDIPFDSQREVLRHALDRYSRRVDPVTRSLGTPLVIHQPFAIDVDLWAESAQR